MKKSSKEILLNINGQGVSKEFFLSELSLLARKIRGKSTKSLAFKQKLLLINTVKQNIIFQILLEDEALQKIEDIPLQEIEQSYQKIIQHFGGEQNFHRHFHDLDSTERTSFAVMQKVEKSLKAQKLIDAWTANLPMPNDTKLLAYFQAHPEFYNRPKSLRLSLFTGTKNAENAAYPKADPIYFALGELKKRYEQKFDTEEIFSMAQQIPFLKIQRNLVFAKGSLPKDIEEHLWSLPDNGLSEVFILNKVYTLCFLEAILAAEEGQFNKLKDEVIRDCCAEEKNLYVRKKLKKLQETAIIEDYSLGDNQLLILEFLDELKKDGRP